MKCRRRLSNFKLCTYSWLIFLGIFLAYNEYLSYFLNTFSFHELQCNNKDQCVKILLVADPQIIGNTREVLHFLTPVTIFDSDRYLMKTYDYAYHFVQPDVVIFLGDLMDEAHIATNEDFQQYVKRIFTIFLENLSTTKSVKHIWLPGDNDIGGEDSYVTKEKLNRFHDAFNQPESFTVKNITFLKINRLTMTLPDIKEKREFYDTTKVFVGLSHIPLMFKPSIFVDRVITNLLPHVLFTAHEHKSMIIRTDALLRHDFHIIPLTPDNNQVFEYPLGVSDMYEILIPTCSYRMGTNKIGYGYAIIENNDLRFTVLWSPSRFEQLISYLVVFLIFCFSSILFLCYTKCTYSTWKKSVYTRLEKEF